MERLPATSDLIDALRAGWWAGRAARSAERQLATQPLHAVTIRRPSALRSASVAGVRATLRLWREPCIVRALVLQAWHAGQGEAREVVIGVTAPSRGFAAHAWLESERPCHAQRFSELMRFSPSAPPDATP